MEYFITFIAELLIDILDLACEYFFTPNYSFKEVTDITDETLKAINESHNIKGIILDVDETIRFNMRSVSSKNDKWIDSLIKNYKVIVLTNGLDHSINSYFNEKGIKVICHAYKPLKRYFINAMNELDLNADEILVIGDSSFTDILGGNRMNMVTCKVKKHKGLIIRNRKRKYFCKQKWRFKTKRHFYL